MAVTLSALRYLTGPDIGPELLRSARFYDIVISGGGRWDRSECLQKMLWWTDGKGTYGRSHKTKVVYRITLLFCYKFPGALGVVIGSIVLAYGCLKFYDIPVRKYLANRFLKHKNKI